MNAQVRHDWLKKEEVEETMSQDMRDLCDFFVKEYLVDFNEFQAAQRIGFRVQFAGEKSAWFMSLGYVQRQLAHFKVKAIVDNPEEIEKDRALIISGLRHLCQNGPYATRVTAYNTLMKMRGFDKPDPSADAETALIEVLKEFAKSAPV